MAAVDYARRTIAWKTALVVWAVLLGGVNATPVDDLPPSAQGTFVQRKVLADVGVTLVSKGFFRFEKGRFFAWDTREPVASLFYATPTNYTFTANGRTFARDLKVDVTSIKSLFAIKEMRDFVASVQTDPPSGFPRQVRVAFKNGDRLEIALHVETGAAEFDSKGRANVVSPPDAG